MTFKQWFTQEYDRKLERRIKHATQFGMTLDEHAKTRDFLRAYMRMHPVHSKTPVRSRFSWSFHPYPIIAGVLIVTLAGGSVGAASLAEQALPGDLLYPIKVNVNEEVRAALASTPGEEADIAIARAERRIEELNTLSERGDIAHEVRAQIDDRIDAQVHAAEVKTGFADDGEKEHRLVAMLRVHENLVASSEIGGAVEPTVTFDMAADTAIEETATSPSEVARMTAPASETATSVGESKTQEVSRAKLSAEIASAPEKNLREVKKTEKQTDNSAKNIARQKKTAKQRIETLEKLLERKGKRLEKETWAHAQSELEAAHAAYEEGTVFFNDESWGDAAVRFNAAIRIAIDAREFLANTPQSENKSGDQKKKSGSRESSRVREEKHD